MTQAPVPRTRFEGSGARARSPTPAYGGVSEPSGYEDARAIRSGVGQHQRAPRASYGGAAVALDEPAGEEDARAVNSDSGQASAAPAPVVAVAPVAVDSTPPANDTLGRCGRRLARGGQRDRSGRRSERGKGSRSPSGESSRSCSRWPTRSAAPSATPRCSVASSTTIPLLGLSASPSRAALGDRPFHAAERRAQAGAPRLRAA